MEKNTTNTQSNKVIHSNDEQRQKLEQAYLEASKNIEECSRRAYLKLNEIITPMFNAQENLKRTIMMQVTQLKYLKIYIPDERTVESLNMQYKADLILRAEDFRVSYKDILAARDGKYENGKITLLTK